MHDPIIFLNNLSRSYGKARGIDHISLEINEGEVFGFIGPNGAGKSTTIRILLNLIFPDSGSASIMGMDVIRDTKKIKQHIGYIPSEAVEYPSMYVRDFLAYCSRFYGINNGEQRIRELTGWFELDPDRRISDLSRGNRKKVSIVQSLLHNPRLLILDEPTMGLDPLMQEKFFRLLRTENRKGMTVFFSSHILSEVQMLCKRVAIIKEGKIIQLEDIETLRKKQLKKISFETKQSGEPRNFSLDGMIDTFRAADNKIAFMFSGDLNDLVRKLAGEEIVNLTIEEPSLEEIFMHYYK